MSYQILDNFLEQSDFENIRKSIINNRFPFYIQDTVAYNKILELVCYSYNL
jgi:hypothetical protein